MSNQHAPLTCSYSVAGGTAGYGYYVDKIYLPAYPNGQKLGEYRDGFKAFTRGLPAGQAGAVLDEPQFGPDAFVSAITAMISGKQFGSCTLDAPAVGGKIVWVTYSPSAPVSSPEATFSWCEKAMKAVAP